MARARGGLSFFGDLAALSGGHLVSKVGGFLVFAMLARTLSRDGYGAVEYLVGLSTLFATAVDYGLGRVGVRRVAHHPASLARLAAQIPVMRLGVALIAAPVMALVAAPAMRGLGAHGLAWLFALSLLAAPWQQDWLLQATGRMNQASFAQALRTLVFALVVLSLVRGPADLHIVGWAEIAAATAMALYCVVVQQTSITRWQWRTPMEGFAGLAGEGALVGLGTFVAVANLYAPLFIVASLVGGEETAWFGAGSRVISSLLTFSNLYYFGLYPAIAGATIRSRDELADLLAASFRVMAWGGTLVALALTLLAQPVCVLVFGNNFSRAAPLLEIMVWTLPVVLLSGHARWSLVAAGEQARLVYANLAGAVAVSALGIPLALLLGGRGAAIAAVAGAVAVWLAAHALATARGSRLPSGAMAAVPVALALAIVGVTHLAGLGRWWAGSGAIFFAAAAPLLDRKLVPDLARLGAVRPDAAGEHVA